MNDILIFSCHTFPCGEKSESLEASPWLGPLVSVRVNVQARLVEPPCVCILFCIHVFVFVHFRNTWSSRSSHYIVLACPRRSACLKIIFFCWNWTVSLFLSLLFCYEVFVFVFFCEIFFVGFKRQSELSNRLCLL